jgi:1-acyl-sn-glycerol-3-phosphate acyltransferase
MHVEGAHNVPRKGPAILAMNHLSFIDSFFIPAVLNRRITYVAKAEYFDDWKTAWFFRSVGQIPIRRGAGSAWRRALDSAAEVLDEGKLFGIYPEGTRSKDGNLHRGHTGIARLVLETGVPVIPVGLSGTDRAMPIGSKFPRLFTKVGVKLGEPLDFSEYIGRTDRQVLRHITDTVMSEIQKLSGQEYVERYAPSSSPAPNGHAPSTSASELESTES